MKLKFAKLNPTENMTILVTSPVIREEQPRIAHALMGADSIGAEQVGFVEKACFPGAAARLQMMGGEFCGNASMSLAALLAYEQNLPDSAETVYPLEVSGVEGIVNCRIARRGSVFLGTVRMPLPESVSEVELDPGLRLPVVRFPGIAQVIVFENRMDSAAARAVIPRWCRALDADALGILLTDESMNRIRPLVYVRETDSSVWERGCGSGTAALGAYAACKSQGNVEIDISQPGGVIRVKADYANGRIKGIEITGSVKISAIGEAFLN